MTSTVRMKRLSNGHNEGRLNSGSKKNAFFELVVWFVIFTNTPETINELLVLVPKHDFSVLANGLAGKSVSIMTYFVSSWTKNLNSINE